MQASQPERKLSLLNLHTGERASSTFWAEGQYQIDELNTLNRLLRDHRNNQITSMDPQLLSNIHQLQQLVGNTDEIHIISGYRSPETNEKLRKMGHKVAKRSFHLSGQAIDLRMPKMALSTMRKVALNQRAGGVGYYPGSNFLHMDTGRVRQWG